MARVKPILGEEDSIDIKKENIELKSKIKALEGSGTHKPFCVCCGTNGNPDLFYSTTNTLYAANDFKLPLCKDCLQKEYAKLQKEYKDEMAIYYLCRELNLFYSNSALDSAKLHAMKTGCSLVQAYMKTINTKINGTKYGSCFAESTEFLDIDKAKKDYAELIKKMGVSVNNTSDLELVDDIDKTSQEYSLNNKRDCIHMLGYDPFTDENEDIKTYLYNTLINYLDDSTLDDPFKLSSCIEIVKMFGQAEQYNKAISFLTSDANTMVEKDNVDVVTSLTTGKTRLTNAAAKLAKENGISVLNATNKAAGAGTLSGKMKKLNEINLREAQVNKFDADTCEGFRQVAEISNNAIIDKLNLKEDELNDMLAEQREMISQLNISNKKLKESLRLARLELYNNNIDYSKTIVDNSVSDKNIKEENGNK